MALVSYGFGFFCAVLLLLYYIVPGRFQWRILLAASVLFYGFAGPLWILYPAASSVSVWYLARKIGSMTDQYRNWVQKDRKVCEAVGPVSVCISAYFLALKLSSVCK